jgi:chloramphenicol 3-O-phosphotransferase
MTGRIIILNGAPRSGKSSLAKAIQASIAGTWLNLGVDSLAASTPPALMPGIGLRPGGEKPDLEPKVAELYDFLFASYPRSRRLSAGARRRAYHRDRLRHRRGHAST